VKKIPLFILRFFILFFSFTILFWFLQSIFLWSLNYFPEKNNLLQGFIGSFFKNLKSSATLAVFVTLIFVPFWIKNLGINRVISFIFSFLLSLSLLFSLFFLITPSAGRENNTENSPGVLMADHIHILSEGVLYLENYDSNKIGFTIFLDTKNPEQGLSFSKTAFLLDKPPRIHFSKKKEIPLEPRNPVFDPMFVPYPGLSNLLSRVALFNNQLNKEYEESRLNFLIYAGVVCFFITSLGTLSRISCWPLINLLGSIAALWFFFILHALLVDSPILLSLVDIVFKSNPEISLVPALLLIFSFILILWDLLFIKPAARA